MKKPATVLAAALFLAGAARAGAPAPVEKAKIKELRADVRDDKHRLKQVALDQHKELVLVREREKSDVGLVKASAAQPETIHQGLLDVREKSRRDRRALRSRRREDRAHLRQAIKNKRAEITGLRQKK